MAGNAKSDGGRGWVGRSIRRLEDPTLVAGRGPLHRRSAGGALGPLRAKPGGGRAGSFGSAHPRARRSITAADLAAVKPIRPMLHKFNYVPISQPVLATRGRALRRRAGRRRGRADARRGRGHRRSRRGRDRNETPAVVDARAALARRRSRGPWRSGRQRRRRRPGEDAGLRRDARAAHRGIKVDIRSRRQNALPMEPRAAHAAWDATSQRVTLHCATQMPHAMRPSSPSLSACRNPICG